MAEKGSVNGALRRRSVAESRPAASGAPRIVPLRMDGSDFDTLAELADGKSMSRSSVLLDAWRQMAIIWKSMPPERGRVHASKDAVRYRHLMDIGHRKLGELATPAQLAHLKQKLFGKDIPQFSPKIAKTCILHYLEGDPAYTVVSGLPEDAVMALLETVEDQHGPGRW